MGTDVATTDRLLRAQWLRLREWLVELDDDATAAPSVLPGWTVAELVAHVGRVMNALAVAQPDDGDALSLGQYLRLATQQADRVDATARRLAQEIVDDPLGALDREAEDAFAHLHDLRGMGPDVVVRARMAPIRLSDLLLTRLLELVVHGDDLDRSLPAVPGDIVLDEALEVVSAALLEVLTGRGAWDLEVVEPRAWVRLACGRTPLSAEAVGAAVRPRHTSDSTPDLTGALPLL
ncbi:maleylpyruvate isomerase N-terminal domain-containing protein [Actinotalea sp. Marseille-Q4924]|uniref:maleylpyruvate isomerase N-terminal domain-containing protein n=1 Tax=Actinotalea sp. Marseille-Q4924 TaxID=2866571 RepID=UPI001CE45BC0|nr:maleylpyruvate isomerase N-terminal domain-containing protein [Actinotalea sp. Marseille-Q4924]